MGIFQARILEHFAISFSRGSSRSRDGTGPPVLQADSLLTELPGKPFSHCRKPNSEYCPVLKVLLKDSLTHVIIFKLAYNYKLVSLYLVLYVC